MFDRVRLLPARVHGGLDNQSSRLPFTAGLDALSDAVAVGAVLIHVVR